MFELPPTDALVVFGLIAIALVLFVTELIPNDVTAIGIVVSLAALEPVTGVGTRDAISGFSSTATITIVAMYMLSAGIQRTGIVQRLGIALARFTRGDERRALAATVVTTGPIAGFVNNTPIVAVFIPMISDLAEKIGVSPSKLLLPLSYAAILGGTLTLIGTSTNLLASELAVDLLEREPIGMFEFTALGLVILSIGIAYLLTAGRWLTPARIPVDADLIEEFDLEDHLTHVEVRADSAPVGLTVRELEDRTQAKVRILHLRRGDDLDSGSRYPSRETGGAAPGGSDSADHVFEYEDGDRGEGSSPSVGGRHNDAGPGSETDGLSGPQTALAEPTSRDALVSVSPDERIREGDVLTVHGTLQAVNRFVENQRLRQLVRSQVTEETFDESLSEDRLAKIIVPPDSSFAGEQVADTGLRTIYETTVLAVRREGTLIRTDLGEVELQPGDLLLVQTDADTIEYFEAGTDLVFVEEDALDRLLDREVEERAPLSPKTPIAIGIMAAVVLAAALGLVSIAIAALAGVFCMIVTGCLSTSEAYDAVSWNIIFLLAGVIPLGIALEATGGSEFIATGLVSTADVLPLVLVLLLFYLVTGLLANVITPVATVVLMIPVAVDAAQSLGASEFSFLLAVMFASATSFMTPVGYQTNLMVYAPGGYEFTDFLKVGGPLQFLLAVVTTAGIALIWGL